LLILTFVEFRLIIASRFRPLPILKQSLFLLAPSSPFVVFHEFLEPLVDCYLWLQESGLALRLNLSETWLREFQTLPGRMRPDMKMTTNGGYLLTGTYIGLEVANKTIAKQKSRNSSSTSDIMIEEK
jgi:tRNA (adenine-N(1)-)-methyltransferase non-catalytic subunit